MPENPVPHSCGQYVSLPHGLCTDICIDLTVLPSEMYITIIRLFIMIYLGLQRGGMFNKTFLKSGGPFKHEGQTYKIMFSECRTLWCGMLTQKKKM